MEIVLATRNPDKVREISAIMAPLDLVIVPLEHFGPVPEVVEDGDTLEANALKKARVVRDATGRCALADDTGLEVDALGGAPGIYSSRYAGEDATYEDNTRKLLQEMAQVPPARRGARFRTVAALALVPEAADRVPRRLREQSGGDSGMMDSERPDALVGEGMLEGRIAGESRGTSGFGYDPVFEAAGDGKTLAEIGLDEKNRISHRYRALVELRELMLRCGLCGER
ncbi:MAG: non-canonical purine NTP pyrophosphatase [Candidatus Krumholzibacteriia bacterium]